MLRSPLPVLTGTAVSAQRRHEVIVESSAARRSHVRTVACESCETCWKPMPQRLRHWRDDGRFALRPGVQESGAAGRRVARAFAQPVDRAAACPAGGAAEVAAGRAAISQCATLPLLPADRAKNDRGRANRLRQRRLCRVLPVRQLAAVRSVADAGRARAVVRACRERRRSMRLADVLHAR